MRRDHGARNLHTDTSPQSLKQDGTNKSEENRRPRVARSVCLVSSKDLYTSIRKHNYLCLWRKQVGNRMVRSLRLVLPPEVNKFPLTACPKVFALLYHSELPKWFINHCRLYCDTRVKRVPVMLQQHLCRCSLTSLALTFSIT